MLRFRQEREFKNLSQNDLANLLGVSQQSISKYENGSREAGYDILIQMSKIFDVSIDYLLGLSNIRRIEDIQNEQLSADEKRIIETYRTIDSDGKQILLGKALDLKRNSSMPNRKKDIG